jgi:hypothetical protein
LEEGWGGCENRGREWIRRGRMSSWGENNGLWHSRRRESEEGKNRDEKILMLKIIQKENRNKNKNKIKPTIIKQKKKEKKKHNKKHQVQEQ